MLLDFITSWPYMSKILHPWAQAVGPTLIASLIIGCTMGCYVSAMKELKI